jgi:ribosomal protein L11 methyltransferase
MRGLKMTDSKWVEITCTVPEPMAEALSDFLLEVTGNGVSIENRNVDTFNVSDIAAEAVKSVKGYIQNEERVEEILAQINEFMLNVGPAFSGFSHIPPTVSILKEEDWANSWKSNFKPTRIGKRLVMKPSWEQFAAEEGDIVLELDPGMAFGTGTHATTRLCLEAIERLMTSEQGSAAGNTELLDVGCGSGVLGIAAALYGAKKVICIDIDPIAVTVTMENAAINGVEKILTASETPLAEVVGTYRIVIANILAEELVKMRMSLLEKMVEGGFLILSGILMEREEIVLSGFSTLPLSLDSVTREDEWCCIIFRKSSE